MGAQRSHRWHPLAEQRFEEQVQPHPHRGCWSLKRGVSGCFQYEEQRLRHSLVQADL